MNKKSLHIEDIFKETNCLTFNQLVAYNKGTLKKKQTFLAERHLIDCEFCSEALEGIENIKDIKKAKARISRVNRKVKNEIYQSNLQRNHLFKSRYFAIAATLLLLASAIFTLKSDTRLKSVFEENFKLYPNLIPIVRGETDQSNFIYAMQAYEMNYFRLAENFLQRISIYDEKYDFALFYMGIIAVKNSEHSRARYIFRKLLESDKRNIRAHAKWYLILIALKTENFHECRKLLIEIINEEPVYRDAAGTILTYVKTY